MLGDILNDLLKKLKRRFCQHKYESHVQIGISGLPYRRCNKCGKADYLIY